MDIVSLYTNVSLDEAHLCKENCLDRRKNQSPPTHFLMEYLDLIFEYNSFKFEESIYRQAKGISMGSAAAPSGTNIYMADWENTYIFDLNINPFWDHILLFRYFIDDYFVLLMFSDMAEKFKRWINTLHPVCF